MTNIVFFCWHYPAAVGFTMYKFIPLPYRVLYINSASFFWNGYLCLRFDTKVQSRNRKQFNRQDNKRYMYYEYRYCCAKDGCSSSITFARKNQTNGGKDKKSDGRALRYLEEEPT